MSSSTERNLMLSFVMSCIDKLKSEFETNPFNFLSESDMKCCLFMELWKNPELSQLKRTSNKQKISSLHSEVSYFDKNRKLNFHVDISAIKPEHTKVYGSRGGFLQKIMLSKGYEFGDMIFVIEVKLNKGRWSKEKTLSKWIKDLEKLEDIITRNVGGYYFSILFDKRNHFTIEEVNRLRNAHQDVKIIYATHQSPLQIN